MPIFPLNFDHDVLFLIFSPKFNLFLDRLGTLDYDYYNKHLNKALKTFDLLHQTLTIMNLDKVNFSYTNKGS